MTNIGLGFIEDSLLAVWFASTWHCATLLLSTQPNWCVMRNADSRCRGWRRQFWNFFRSFLLNQFCSRKLAFSTSSETDISVRSIFWLFQCCAEGIVPIRNCLHLAGKVESRIEKKKLPSRFEIVVGRCAFGQLIDMELFGISVRNSPMDRIAALKNAVSSYSSFMSQLQGRVVCWLLVGKAIGLYKDVNVLIAKTVWNVTLSEIFEE
jgi:hypothetical protein